MKIALAAPTHLPARRANTIQVMKMAQALVKTGHTVRLAVPGKPPADQLPTWEALARQYGLEAAFPVEWLPSRPSLRRYDYGVHALRWARGWGADLLYTRLPQAAALASRTGLPVIFEAHELPHGRLGPWVFRQFLRGQGARRLVAITHALAADLHQQFGSPLNPPFTCVAPDGVDLERYQDLPAPPAARAWLAEQRHDLQTLRRAEFTAGYTGHLYPGRGEELLLDLARQLPEICFLVVGGEPHAVERLHRLAQERQLDNLLLAGFVPNADLPLYQAACDVLLLPYGAQVAGSSGGDIAPYFSPMKLFEYLASGRAILSSDLPALREVLHAGSAAFAHPGAAAEWAQQLQSLREDGELRLRLGRQARQDAQRYTWEARSRAVLEGLA
jgi:glycosyltransferase involved in cell wall biosynthesis